MKRILFGLVAGVALIGTPALAADMDARWASNPPADPPFSWTGFYLGGYAGGAWTRDQMRLASVAGPLYTGNVIGPLEAVASTNTTDLTAAFGGRLGYNYQTGHYVWGLEGDFTSTRSSASRFTTGNPFGAGAGNIATFNNSTSTDWVSSIRPRWGFLTDRVMLYATGGVAFGKVSFANSYFAHSPLGAGPTEDVGTTSASQVKVGWAVGGGFNYAIDHNWILSLDYLHIDLGHLDATEAVVSGNGNTATLKYSTLVQTDLFVAGVAYKFY